MDAQQSRQGENRSAETNVRSKDAQFRVIAREHTIRFGDFVSFHERLQLETFISTAAAAIAHSMRLNPCNDDNVIP